MKFHLFTMEDNEPVTRESVLQLMERKDEIEKKLHQLKQVLDGASINIFVSIYFH